MFMLRAALLLCLAAALQAQTPRLGRALTPDEVRKLDITVAPDGAGLPPGSGSVSAGAAIFAQKCQACHGDQGAGKPQRPAHRRRRFARVGQSREDSRQLLAQRHYDFRLRPPRYADHRSAVAHQ